MGAAGGGGGSTGGGVAAEAEVELGPVGDNIEGDEVAEIEYAVLAPVFEPVPLFGLVVIEVISVLLSMLVLKFVAVLLFECAVFVPLTVDIPVWPALQALISRFLFPTLAGT